MGKVPTFFLASLMSQRMWLDDRLLRQDCGRGLLEYSTAPSLEDLTGALTCVEEERKPGIEEVQEDFHNEKSDVKNCFSEISSPSSQPDFFNSYTTLRKCLISAPAGLVRIQRN